MSEVLFFSRNMDQDGFIARSPASGGVRSSCSLMTLLCAGPSPFVKEILRSSGRLPAPRPSYAKLDRLETSASLIALLNAPEHEWYRPRANSAAIAATRARRGRRQSPARNAT